MPIENIASSIVLIRGQKVLLDADLATLYGVTTKRFNEQIRRNAARFPTDFMFQLTAAEVESLRSQIATLKPGRGKHRKYRPYAFTEHGAWKASRHGYREGSTVTIRRSREYWRCCENS